MCVGSPTAGTWSSSQWRPDNEFETDRGRALGCAVSAAAAPIAALTLIVDQFVLSY